jgi:large subunit ribosomal protein L30
VAKKKKVKKLKITQTKSVIGYKEFARRTLKALGLRHPNDSVILPDNPAIRGMIKRVQFMVSVDNVEE